MFARYLHPTTPRGPFVAADKPCAMRPGEKSQTFPDLSFMPDPLLIDVELTTVNDHSNFSTSTTALCDIKEVNGMQTMTVSKFQATCLAVLERVRKTGEPVLVTKHGVPIVQVLPAPPPSAKAESAFGCMAGTAEETGDILAPLPNAFTTTHQ